jgi:hypothetical protein
MASSKRVSMHPPGTAVSTPSVELGSMAYALVALFYIFDRLPSP